MATKPNSRGRPVRAQKTLRATRTSIAAMAREEVQALVHELQVHQMELEIQNEELRRAQLELVESRDRYSILFDSAPVGYITVDADSRIREANLTAGKMLGVERRGLLKRKLSSFVAREALDNWRLHRQAAFAGDTRHSCELAMHSLDGRPLVMRLESMAFGSGPDRRCHIALIDVTDRNQAEVALRRLTQFPEKNPGLVLQIGKKHDLLYANPAARAWLAEEWTWKAGAALPRPLAALAADAHQYGVSVHAEFIGASGSVFAVFAACPPGEDYVNAYGYEITERKRAEEALRESEERLRLAAEATGFGTYDFDPRRCKSVWSPQLCALFGLPLMKEVSAELFTSVVHPKDRAKFTRRVEQALDPAGQTRHEFEYRIVRPDGELRWVHDTGRSLYEGEGVERRVVRVVGTVQDVTERKQVEQALRQSEERLQHALAAGAMGTWERDFRTGEIKWDKGTYKMYGIEAGTKIDIDFFHAHVHREDLPVMLAAIEDSASRGNEYRSEFRFLRPDGNTIWIQARGGLRRDEFGSATHIAGVNFEVTERKRAEEALRASEELYRATFENAAVGIAHVVPDGRFLGVNDKLCQILGYRREQLLTKALQDLTHPDDVEGNLTLLKRALAGEIETYTMEKRYIRNDGSTVWTNLTTSLIREPRTRAPLYFISIVEDITQRKRAEDQLRHLTEQLEQRVLARTVELKSTQDQLRALTSRLHDLQEDERAQLARDLHDEFGAALTALKVDLYSIMEQLPRKTIALKQKAGAMSALIDNTVDSLRRTAALLRPRLLDDFGLVAAIEWQTQEFERRTGVRCQTTLPEGFSLDRQRSTVFYRILQEGLTNVLRHAKATEVVVRLWEDSGKVLLEIKDDGIGINPEAISNRKSFGLIGMRERAYAFGGEVSVERSWRGGTVVTVEIPRNKRV